MGKLVPSQLNSLLNSRLNLKPSLPICIVFVITVITIIIFIVSILITYIAYTTPTFYWISLDVTKNDVQGDAHLLNLNGNFVLIDTGHMVESDNLINNLKKRNVQHLQKIIITHAHIDHYGGLTTLLKNFSVKEVYFNFPTKAQCIKEPWGCNLSDLDKIQQALQTFRVKLLPLRAGDKFDYTTSASNGKYASKEEINSHIYRKLSLEIIYAFDGINTPAGDGTTDLNDTSAIILIRHGFLKFLFTGDINFKIGRWIADREKDGDKDKENKGELIGKVDVLKVPHHAATALPDINFFNRFVGRDVIITAPLKLWESNRCQQFKDIITILENDSNLNHKVNLYINGANGDIKVRSYAGYFYKIKVEKNIY
ncbi:MAG: MBL fold metallo-hydrolase [Oligoflexia bacterium]|nr:MBL fold metallo-hydrolase [Oligoflexia bacterium]